MESAQSVLGTGPATTSEHSHFVYLYRDLEGRPVYVGRGAEISRAEDHTLGTHNPGPAELIAKDEYMLRSPGHTVR